MANEHYGSGMNGMIWETEAFPESDCVHPCPREEGILEGKSLYLCVVVDHRFGDTAHLILAYPYTCPALPENGGGTLWGWSSQGSKQWYDHKTRSIHDDDERVVAWTRVADSYDLRLSLFPG
jgi:hypothetical protein